MFFFNDTATTEIYTLSLHDALPISLRMDLFFAITRFCAAAGIEKAVALSDHRDASFGSAYGVLIKELRLLARSVFIIDKDDVIRYVQIVPEQLRTAGSTIRSIYG